MFIKFFFNSSLIKEINCEIKSDYVELNAHKKPLKYSNLLAPCFSWNTGSIKNINSKK